MSTYPLPPPLDLSPPKNTKSPTPFYQHPPVQVARPPPPTCTTPRLLRQKDTPIQVARLPPHSTCTTPRLLRQKATLGSPSR